VAKFGAFSFNSFLFILAKRILARFLGEKKQFSHLLPQKAFKYNNKNGQGN